VVNWKKNYYSTTAGGAADGGSTSTLDDLVKFSRALRDGKLFKKELVDTMLTPKVVADENPRWRYGFGCFILLDDHQEQILRWGHTGEEDGVSCRYWYYPQQDVDVVILGNQSSCASKVAWDIHDFVLDM
jgi:CubicO group peptidase (beta-lactamase class C family)